jgi:hypothetical protein
MARSFTLQNGDILVIPEGIHTETVSPWHPSVTGGRAVVEVQRIEAFAASLKRAAESVDFDFVARFSRRPEPSAEAEPQSRT